jgi:nitric oxide reductase large subunit
VKKHWIAYSAVFVLLCAVLAAVGVRVYTQGLSLAAIASALQTRIQSTVRIAREAPPLPDHVITADGTVVIPPGDIEAGRNVWRTLRKGETGSVFGQDGSDSPDWTADWLHREALFILNEWSEAEFGVPYKSASASQQAALTSRLHSTLRKNTYDGLWNAITVEPVRGRAIAANTLHYSNLFTQGSTASAMRNPAPGDSVKLRQLSAFFFWTSWAASTNRLGDDVTYTSNWPHEDLVGNEPSRDAVGWTVVSMFMLLAGVGLMARSHWKNKEEELPGSIHGLDALAHPGGVTLRQVLPALVLLSSAVIIMLSSPALASGTRTNPDAAEYMVGPAVDVWVEESLGAFTSIVIVLAFARMKLISFRSASRAVTQITAAFFAAASLGAFAYAVFAGTPTFVIALAPALTALTVAPLLFVCIDAWKATALLPPGLLDVDRFWAIRFFLAAAFWNLASAGLFGLLTASPVAMYYLQGLTIGSIYERMALLGVCGMLGIGSLLSIARSRKRTVEGIGRSIGWTFWLLNIGLCAMLALSLVPTGLIQAWASVGIGYWYARSFEFVHTNTLLTTVRSMHLIGEALVAAGIAVLVFKGIQMRSRNT